MNGVDRKQSYSYPTIRAFPDCAACGPKCFMQIPDLNLDAIKLKLTFTSPKYDENIAKCCSHDSNNFQAETFWLKSTVGSAK